jgi:two-component system chemotaxis response regulator CheY
MNMALNVLVVDDSPVMRRMVRRSLGMCGLPMGEIYEAGNGAEGLAVLGERWVDVVIADVNMPEVDGVEMVERMAADGMLARLPVVMVSSDRSEARIERLKALGVRAYLTKPFRPEAFREVVEATLPIAGSLKAEPSVGMLAETGASCLEECVFVLARPAEGRAPFPAEVSRASINFEGTVAGRLVISTGSELGLEIAAGMLGVDPADPEAHRSVDPALGELVNILAGVLAERLYGPECAYRIGLPELSRGPSEPPGPPGTVLADLVDDEGRGFRICLSMQRTAPRSAQHARVTS